MKHPAATLVVNSGPGQLRRQRGSMLLGVIITVIVIGILMIGLVRSNIERANERAGAAQGQSIADINKALGQYITNSSNMLALQTAQPITGVANTMAPQLAELQALGYLSANFSVAPAHGGAYKTEVILLPAGCVATACNIATRLWMTKPVLDGFTGKPDIKRIGSLISVVGGNAGFSDPATPAVIRGSSWTLPNPLGAVAGTVLVINGAGSLLDPNYVRIRDSRDPNLRGNLSVAGDVNAAGYLGVGGLATFGGTCTTAGALGKTSTGVLMICQGGNWMNTSGVDQLAVAGGPCVAGQVGRDSSGILLSCQGGFYRNAAGLSAINVSAGGACPTAGLLGLDAGGVAYLCRGGIWAAQSALMPLSVEMGRVIVSDGDSPVAKPSCAAGGTPTYDMTPMSVSLDLTVAPPYSALTYSATDTGAGYSPSIKLVAAQTGATQSARLLGVSALMKLYCVYPF